MRNGRKNTYISIRDREYGCKNYYRSNLFILRNLMTYSSNSFVPFWKKTSKSYFFLEKSYVFENYMQKSYIMNTRSTPSLLYNIEENISKYGKIMECIVSSGPMEKMNSYDPDSRNQFSMFAITRMNYLLHINILNGKVIHALLLSKLYNFRWINWDVLEERFYISSTKSKNQSSPIMALQIFSVWPLTYHGLYEIHSSVFGENISDVMLSNYLLMISYTSSQVKFYSFPMPEVCSSSTDCLYNISSKEVKSMEHLSLKIEFSKKPQMLLEIHAPHSILSIGGIPWHCITSANNCRYLWEIKSLKTNAKCHEGYLGSEKPSLEPDRCFFHPDESGKIIVSGSDHVTVYTLDSNEVNRRFKDCTLKKLYSIAHPHQINKSIVTHTQSGRKIKTRVEDAVFEDQRYSSIQCLSFEDELDVMVITTLQMDPNTNKWHGVVNVHNNQTGDLLMRYQLNEAWDRDGVHNVEMDRDFIYHLTKKHSKYVLYVHKFKVDSFF